MKQILKKTARLLVILLIGATAVVVGLFLISHFYGDRVKQLFVEELNKHLTIELSVETIEFNVFENFPFASVQFRKVTSHDKSDQNKPALIKAEEIDVIFNFYDLIRKNYRVERLFLKDAFLNLETSSDGKRNFDIFRKSDITNNTIEFNLQKFIFRNVEIAYINYPADHDFLFSIKKGEIKGKYNTENLEFVFGGSVFTTYLTSGNVTILKEKEMDLYLDLSYNFTEEKLTTHSGTIKSEGMKFDISGEMITRTQQQNLDLKIVSARTSLVTFLNLIPPGFLDPLADYKITGDFDFIATLKGSFSGKHIPVLNIAFNFDHGKILNPGSGFTMDKVNFSGKFNNGGRREEKFYSLELRDIKANIRGGVISGNLNIRDFHSPEVSVQLNSVLNLRELKAIYPVEYLQTIDGTLEMQMTFSNKLKDFRKFTMEDFLSSRTSGTMSFRDMNFSVRGNRLKYSNFNGSFRFSNKDLVIDAFSGKVSDSDFSMTGILRNILPYTFRPDEKLFVQARVNSHHIHLDQLLAYKELTDDEPYNLKISDQLNFDMNVNVGSFRFRKFSGQNVKGMFSQHNKMFSVREGSLHTMDGMVNLNGSIDGKNEHSYLLTCDAVLEKVDIRKLFYDFGNFGQENLTDSHLKGSVSAKVYYHSTLTPSLYVNPASVYSLADITINNGELIRYTPLFALSRYVKQETLEHIRFSTLKNNIRIEKRVIYFPQMEINSNTLNITLFGTHDFDNITDYHFQLLLSELLVKNQRDSEPIPGIFEKETEGGKAKLFLSMTGPADNPTIRYDTREVRKKIASDLASEKVTLTEVMKNEFRWITGQKKEEEKFSEENFYTGSGSPDFVFEWEETKKDSPAKTTTPVNKKAVKPKEKKAEKDFIIRWDED
jgi:hypothetical protein